MSTLNSTRKVSRRNELREDTVVTAYARGLGYFENNRNLVLGVLGGIILVVLAFVAYAWNQNRNNEKALAEMAVAVQKYEAGEYQASLDGDASFVGLIDIASDYGSTTSGNLAQFYAADALFRTGDMDRALSFFEDYSKDANYIGASAFAGEAAIHELKGNFKKAGDLFSRAATIYESEITSPMYFESAARAYEAAQDFSKAHSVYETIKEDYPDSQQARDADFYIAKLDAAK